MRYSPHQYADTLHELMEETSVAKRRDVMREFLETVAKNGSLNQLSEIVREFELLSDKKAGIKAVTIQTPERLSETTVAKELPFKVRVTALRDVRLEGGAVIEVDDLRIDNSIRSRLERARKAFTK